MSDKLSGVLVARKTTHGDFKTQFECAQELKGVLKRYQAQNPCVISSVAAEALDQICHKISRIATGDPQFTDHWRDIGGYATLIADMLDTKSSPPSDAISLATVAVPADCTYPQYQSSVLPPLQSQYADPHTNASQRAAERADRRIDVA